MQELVKGYIGALESRELELPDASSQRGSGSSDEETQWLKALRWCPRELLDLINSKACRGGRLLLPLYTKTQQLLGAIMFNDPLNTEQCERLVKQLSATVFPFQCAHGRYIICNCFVAFEWMSNVDSLFSFRPSLVPLTRLISKSGGPKETGLEWEKVAAL